MTSHQTNTGYEPNASTIANVSVSTASSEMDTSGARFVPTVDVTHNDDDTNSHVSDIWLQLPASAHFPSKISALVTFPQAGRKGMQNVQPADTKSDRSESLAITASSKCTCRSWTSRSGSIGYTTSTRSTALDVLYYINKENFLLPLINMQRLQGKTLSTF